VFELVNLDCKITQHARAEVHAPGVLPSVQRQVNVFGVFLNVFTSTASFHTVMTLTETRFSRGGLSDAVVQESIEHVFVADSVAEVLMNNVVFCWRLDCPVSRHNRGICCTLEGAGLARSWEQIGNLDAVLSLLRRGCGGAV
jgi:hypothetical protein